MAGAAVMDRVLYVVGGIDGSSAAVDTVYRLALDAPGATWTTLEQPLPAGSRILPSVVAQFGQVVVAGGRTPSAAGWTADTAVWA